MKPPNGAVVPSVGWSFSAPQSALLLHDWFELQNPHSVGGMSSDQPSSSHPVFAWESFLNFTSAWKKKKWGEGTKDSICWNIVGLNVELKLKYLTKERSKCWRQRKDIPKGWELKKRFSIQSNSVWLENKVFERVQVLGRRKVWRYKQTCVSLNFILIPMECYRSVLSRLMSSDMQLERWVWLQCCSMISE